MPLLTEQETIERTAITPDQQYELNQIFWKWFDLHAEDKVVSLGVLILRVTVRVKHLHPLWVILFGVRQ